MLNIIKLVNFLSWNFLLNYIHTLIKHRSVLIIFQIKLTHLFSECFFEPDGLAPVIGFSSNKAPISDSCLATVKNVLATDGVPPQDYFIAPGSMDCACVTDLDCSSG